MSYCSLMLWISISFYLKQNIVNADRFRKRKRAFQAKQTNIPSPFPVFSKFSNESDTNHEIHVETNYSASSKKRKQEKGKHPLQLQVKDSLKTEKVFEEKANKKYPFYNYLETHDGNHEGYDTNNIHFNGTYGVFHKPNKRESTRIIPNVSIKKKKNHVVPSLNSQNTETNDIYLQSFNVKKQKSNVQLNTDILANSHIELHNKMTQQLSNKTGISPTLNFFASKALDGVLGGIQQQLQGPVPLDPAGNNSPLAMPIVTPNLGPNMNTLPGQAVSNIVSNVPPTINQPPPASSPRPPPPSSPQSPSSAPPAPSSSQPPIPLRGGMPNGGAPNPMLMTPQMNPNPMPFGDISNSSAFNIHPTGVNMKDNPSNVTSSEVVSITIGIVLSLFFFCFISGCLVKMCKSKKRRRR